MFEVPLEYPMHFPPVGHSRNPDTKPDCRDKEEHLNGMYKQRSNTHPSVSHTRADVSNTH